MGNLVICGQICLKDWIGYAASEREWGTGTPPEEVEKTLKRILITKLK